MVMRGSTGGLAALSVGALAFAAAFLPATGATAAATSAAATSAGGRLVCPQFNQLPSKETTLSGVATVSAKDAWLVGSSGDAPVVEHYDGTKWSAVRSPALTTFGLLFAAAKFPGGAWAVGTSGTPEEGGKPIVYRLTGTNKVQAMPMPKLPAGRLISVSVISAKNAWASGFLGHGTSLVMHWDGTSWKRASFPGKGDVVTLAISANDVWATASPFNGSSGPLMWNWNGKHWRQTKLPAALSKPGYVLNGMSASSAKDAWAVGDFLDENLQSFTVAVHWNGAKWSVEKTPALPITDGARFLGVSAISPKDAWAVGDNVHFPAVIEHWDGTAWKVVQSPSCGGLNAISLAPGGKAWAVGSEADAQDNIPFVLRFDGKTWKKVSLSG